ncbi:ribonuclease J1 [Gorillibacterium sp. sgz5001074]|uniref:ribonuclease J1 n=1 Tax=Gorillibacterium sp. sgz5001074 TaxID=3446695 RepID=UPI003F680FB9
MNQNPTSEPTTEQRKKPARRRSSRGLVKIFGLGGMGEIGKNMYGIQYKQEIVVIDCGVKFPGRDMPGVDYIIPNIEYLLQHKDQVKGIFITHGHEDHIGGLPFILKELNVPVYGAPLTIGLIRSKLDEHRLLATAQLHVIQDDTVIALDALKVRFYRTSHSIPDAFGVVVDTPIGPVVHTGDFKFDFSPEDKPADLYKMAKLGEDGVLALLADSTNSEKPGFSPSEKVVGRAINTTFGKCRGRILFATFASNVHRLQQVVEAAIEHRRKIAVIGRSMEKVFDIGQELGYIRLPEGMLIDVRDVDRYLDEEIVIICTGSQGEPNAALSRIASGSHKYIQIQPGDTVIFSSSPIPGNTQNINQSIDRLLRAGAHVIYGSIVDIHTSGHGCQEDLKLMLRLMKPKFFIPIHGEYRMLVQHAALAEKIGIPRSDIHLMGIGDTLTISRTEARRGSPIPAGEVFVNGSMPGGLDRSILDERRKLSDSGLIIVVAALDKERMQVLAGPDIVSRGFVYIRDSGALIAQAEAVLRRVIKRLSDREVRSVNVWKKEFADALHSFFESKLQRSPEILTVISEVEPD